MSDAPQNPYSKSVRNLKKKLADIIALEEKSASGATLTPEQQAKLATQGKVAAEFAGTSLPLPHPRRDKARSYSVVAMDRPRPKSPKTALEKILQRRLHKAPRPTNVNVTSGWQGEGPGSTTSSKAAFLAVATAAPSSTINGIVN